MFLDYEYWPPAYGSGTVCVGKDLQWAWMTRLTLLTLELTLPINVI